MNKVISIHLGGKSYQVEEFGFDALRAYLEEAGRHLAENPDKAEIIKDLEQAIAEKCARYLNNHKDVVTTTELEMILAEMGPVSGEEHAKTDAPGSNDKAGAPKRLYLIREGAVIGGVAAGIAAYLNIDVTLVRIAFVALTVFTGGGFICAYIAAMILIPYAYTSEQKAAARGLPFNAQELVNKARAQYKEFAEGGTWRSAQWNQWKTDRHEWKNNYRTWKQDFRAQKAAVRANRSPALGAIATLIGVVWIVALIGIITSGTIFGWSLPATIPLWVAIVILFVLFHAVTGPLQSGRGHNGYSDPWFALVDGIGILFIAIAFGFTYIHYPSVQEFVNHIPAYIHNLYLRITN
jgi:phage shock protein PspC (stress-responsive transcriptional regulator)